MLRSISRPFSAVVGFLAVSLAASILFAASPMAAATNHQVQISGFAFRPGTLTVTVGDTVTWTNADDSPHTVTAESGPFDSGNIDEGGSYSFTFTKAGTYAYRCDYHSEMKATIVVVAPAEAPAPAAPAAPGNGGQDHPNGHGPASDGSGASTDQPDTAALPPASSIPGMSFVLWGLGLIVLGATLLPSRRSVVRVERPLGGWRR